MRGGRAQASLRHKEPARSVTYSRARPPSLTHTARACFYLRVLSRERALCLLEGERATGVGACARGERECAREASARARDRLDQFGFFVFKPTKSEVKAELGFELKEKELPEGRLHRKQVGNSTLFKRDSACVEFKSVR